MAIPLAIPAGAAAAGWIARIAPRLGLSSAAKVWNFAKSNPTTFLLAAKETVDQGVALYDVLEQSYPDTFRALYEASDIPNVLGSFRSVDSVSSGLVDELETLEDEMVTIDHAIRVLGSIHNVQTIRRVLTMDDAHFAAYHKLRRIGKMVG